MRLLIYLGRREDFAKIQGQGPAGYAASLAGPFLRSTYSCLAS